MSAMRLVVSTVVTDETGDWKVARTRRLESLRYGSVTDRRYKAELPRQTISGTLPAVTY